MPGTFKYLHLTLTTTLEDITILSFINRETDSENILKLAQNYRATK